MNDGREVLTHSSIRITDGDRVIYLDPFRVDREYGDATHVLITHDHFDHFSPEDIGKVANRETVLIVPETMRRKVRAVSGSVGDVVFVAPCRHYEAAGLAFDTVPSYNVGKPFHPKKAGWCGYVLSVSQGRVYVAGDTDSNEDVLSVKCDTALVPAGGTYTMDAREAAEFVNSIGPSVAIPTHYGTVAGKPGDGALFASLVREPVKAVLKIKF